jgi:HAD superfamily 5'-nucleotidase-like hydrolase
MTSERHAPSRSQNGRAKGFLLKDRFIPRPERVFTNRNMRLSSVHAIGFDLDHTLAHYDALAVERLAFEVTKKKLVEKRGYPEETLRLRYDPDFVVRGLLVDKRRGNILKLDTFKYVTRTYHGRRRLPGDERRKVYRVRQPRPAVENFASVDTLFHLPEVYLFLALVELLEARQGAGPVDFSRLYLDVRELIDEAHADGSIKRVIVADPAGFIRRDAKLGLTLDEFRRSGKKLFLLTNSEYYYSDALLRHLLERRSGDRPWQSYFDLLVFDSRKPAFFLNSDDPGFAARELPGAAGVPCFSGGTAAFLEERIGAAGDQILYFGDHTYGDILRSKKSLGWRTAMIVPELERELAIAQKLPREYAQLERLLNAHEQVELAKAEVGRKWRRMLEETHRAIVFERHPEKAGARGPTLGPAAAGGAGRPAGDPPGTGGRARGRTRQVQDLADSMADLDHRAASLAGEVKACRRRIEEKYNLYWGSVFREGNEGTRFGQQIRDFACLYTSRVSNFLHYPTSYYFQSPLSLMPHDL